MSVAARGSDTLNRSPTQPTRSSRALHDLAREHGVQIGYRRFDGRNIRSGDDALVSVLRALGCDIQAVTDAPGALASARRERSRRALAPVIVQRSGRRCTTTISLPSDVSPDQVTLELQLEDGSETHRALHQVPKRRCDTEWIDGSSYVRHHVAPLDHRLPAGYHRLRIEGPGISGCALVVAAPARCPVPDRTWGTFMPLYALRRRDGDLGTGSYRDLAHLGEWTGERGGAFVGTLPVYAPVCDPATGCEGPYLPSTRLAWNEAYVDLESLPELRSDDEWAAEARRELEGGQAGGDLHRLGNSDRSDIWGVMRAKRRVLDLLARSLLAAGGSRSGALHEFSLSRPELVAYSRFSSACERIGHRWRRWPKCSPGELPTGAVDEGAVWRNLYSQWSAEQQLATRSGAGMYLDVPVGVHGSGFDTWRDPTCFAEAVSGGAPPDAFFAAGQTWGFPPLHPERIRDQGYRYVIQYLRHLMAHADMVRIDHAMGLHRLYWVPDGLDPRHGAYVQYRADELHAIVVLEAARAGTAVVGEDLGTVPSSVRKAMSRDGMLSSFVFEFESTVADPLPSPPQQCLASFGTHDLPTFYAFWSGSDICEQRELESIDQHQADDRQQVRDRWRRALLSDLAIAHDESADADAKSPGTARKALAGVLEDLGSSPAAVVMVDLEDLWLEPRQQNRPGTTGEDAGNFCRRATRTLEDLAGDPDVTGALAALASARRHDEAAGSRPVASSRREAGHSRPAAPAARTRTNRSARAAGGAPDRRAT